MRTHHYGIAGVMLLVYSLGACTGPPEAPKDYEPLTAYIFAHMDDEDPAALAAGVEQLSRWLKTREQLQETLQGVQLTEDLDEEVVDGLDGSERTATGLLGISYALKSPHDVGKLAKTLVWSGYDQVMDHLPLYERTFEPEGFDTSCFYNRGCDRLTAQVRIQADWSIFGMVESREILQYRWVNTKDGWALLQRAWLVEPVHVSSSFGDVELDDIYTLVVNLPHDGIEDADLDPGEVQTAGGLQGGAEADFEALYLALCAPGTLRVESRWMRGSYPLMSDDMAMDENMKSAKSDATRLDEWISANYALVTPEEEGDLADEQGSAAAGYCGDLSDD